MRPSNLTDNEPRPGVREIKVEGELDLSNVEQLREALNRAADVPLVLIDLSECDFIDSTVVAVVLRAEAAMKEEGRRLGLCGPFSRQVYRALEIMGLSKSGFVFDSAKAASEAAG